MKSIPASIANFRRLIIFVATGIFSTVFALIFYQAQIRLIDFVNNGIVGLIIFELLYQTKKWLYLKTLGVYVLLVLLLNLWVHDLLFYIVYSDFPSNSLGYLFIFPSNLFIFIESFILTGMAYYLVIYQKDSTPTSGYAEVTPRSDKSNSKEGEENQNKVSKTIHVVTSIIYSLIIVINIPVIFLSLNVNYTLIIYVAWAIASIFISKLLFNRHKTHLGYLVLFSPLIIWVYWIIATL